MNAIILYPDLDTGSRRAPPVVDDQRRPEQSSDKIRTDHRRNDGQGDLGQAGLAKHAGMLEHPHV
ncbi:hypothetical protein [Sphingomonas citricola]|uniref:hypothetical protein n=1 Tax=Sphingomonas citricola TaxID=2862498 RepID=UPI0021561A71|nr:hypothetical protein [Sphingomonas citricola]